MRRLCLVWIVVQLAVSLMATAPAFAEGDPLPPSCDISQTTTGSLWAICLPDITWNGNLVVFAHGYVPPDSPLGFHNLELSGVSLPELFLSWGFAFATTTYPVNGLATLVALADVKALADSFTASAGPARTYLVGVSDGGLVATLGVERYPGTFNGGLALCGPIGDFQRQVNYIGDYRVLFDYFFPGVLPPTAIEVPDFVVTLWSSYYSPLIMAALTSDPGKTAQLTITSRAAIDPGDPNSAATTAAAVLWRAAFATNDANSKLGGNPFDNWSRRYRGSSNDRLLNRSVERFRESRAAAEAIEAYQTSGALAVPLVTMHDTADPVIPYWHELLYAAKTGTRQRDNLVQIPVPRYGHCMFELAEFVYAFNILMLRVTGSQADVLP